MNCAALPRLLIAFLLAIPGGAGAAAEPSPSPEYRLAMNRAVVAFHARDYRRTMEALDAAEKIVPPSPMTLNIRASVALEMHEYNSAMQLCEGALKLDPKFFPAQFNRGEIIFARTRYAEARKIYEELLAATPKNETLQFRIFLTHLLERNEAAAGEALEKIKNPGDTGAYYFAKAAWEFSHQKPQEANSWISSANRIFQRERNRFFLDALYDLGWLPHRP